LFATSGTGRLPSVVLVPRINLTLCVFPNRSIYQGDVWIDYTIANINYNYFTDDSQLDNTTQAIILYTQDGTSGVQFRVTEFIGDKPIANAYIKVLKFDAGVGLYKTVEILKTDSEGYALGNIVLQTSWYKFLIVYDGRTRLATEPEKFPSGTTTRSFRINLDETWYDNYDIVRGVETSLVFNNATYNFRYTFNDPSGAMHEACLKVEKINATETKVIADNCTESTAGTLLVGIGTPPANLTGHYIAKGYLKFDQLVLTDFLEKIWQASWKIFKLTDASRGFGLFISFMIVITLTFIGIWNPMTAIIMSLVGIVTTSLLGFFELTIGSIMALTVLGLVLIWRMSRK